MTKGVLPIQFGPLHVRGSRAVQLDRVLRFNESDFELFLYYGQINKNKEEFSIRAPLKIFLCALHQWFFTAVVQRPQSGHGVHRLPTSVVEKQRAGERRERQKCGLSQRLSE